MTDKTRNPWLAVILAVSAILSVLFAARVPFTNQSPSREVPVVINPDETGHYDYLRLMIQNRGFVTFVPPEGGKLADGALEPWESHQPPLYYLLCLPFYVLSGGSVFVVRLVAGLLQLVTIYVAFRACRDLFPERAEVALGAAAFVAFLPMQAQLAGAINNDALTTLFCAAVFWKLGRLVQRGQKRSQALLLGALLGGGLLTKLTVFQLFPVVLLAYLVAARTGKMTTNEAVQRCATAIGVALVIASPWLIRNTLLYGDPLAMRIYPQTGPNFPPDQVMGTFGWSAADYARNVGTRSFASFWYLISPFQPLRIFAGPPEKLAAVLLLTLAALLGLYNWFKEAQGTPEQRRAMGLYFAGVLLLVPFFAKFVMTFFQAQGRYFLPALLPVALISIVGWAGLAREGRQGKAVAAGCGILLALCIFQIAMF